MAISQKRSKRKNTGGRYKNSFSKKKAHNGSEPVLTKIGSLKLKILRVLGGNKKAKTMFVEEVNVADAKGKVSKDVVVNVVDNTANRNYIRRNIITKGAVVELKSGKKAKITSRPGQGKVLNAVLVE